jgi:hypothetical protein
MPKAAAAFRLVVAPTKWRPMSVPPWSMNHCRATAALAMVSCVVKVLLAMMNSVLSGRSLRSTGVMSCRRHC